MDGMSARTLGAEVRFAEVNPSRTEHERGKGGATPFQESMKAWASLPMRGV